MKKENRSPVQFLFVWFSIVFMIASCQAKPTTEPPINDQLSSAYPGSVSSTMVEGDLVDESYPINNEESESSDYYPETVEIPAAESNTGVVTGKLFVASTQDPYLAPALYLGNYLKGGETNSDLPKAISISPEKDPKAIQAQDGTFVFTDVQPGEYGLFIWTPMNFFLVQDSASQSGENIIVVVNAGEITDLGEVLID